MNHDSKPDGPPAPPIALECYEGPDREQGGKLELSEDDLVRHTLVCGASGSGKTFLLTAITEQLIRLHGSDRDRRTGLLVFDFKGDDTVSRITNAARAAGRERDVRVLCLDNEHVGYDFFHGCRSLRDVTEFADRTLFACGPTNSDRFWDEYRHGLITAALSWHVLAGRTPDFGTWLTHAADWIFRETWEEATRTEIGQLRALIEQMPAGVEKLSATQALRTISDFESMEYRTKTNVRACLQNALNPLLTPEVLRIMRSDTVDRFNVADVFEEGKILVVSISAFLHPQLAALVGRAVKADFFKAAMQRRNVTSHTRLAMLVADEFQLCTTCGQARFDDAVALPLLRSFRAGVIASIQTLAALDLAVGPARARTLLPNFNTLFAMRSSEPELQQWIAQILGTNDRRVIERERLTIPTDGGLINRFERITDRMVRLPVCSPGALARLHVGQAYVHSLTNPVTYQPVWIVGGASASPAVTLNQ